MTTAPTAADSRPSLGWALLEAIRIQPMGYEPNDWDESRAIDAARAFLAAVDQCTWCFGEGEVEVKDSPSDINPMYMEICERCNGIGYVAKEQSR